MRKHDWRTSEGSIIVECCRENQKGCPYACNQMVGSNDTRIKACLSTPCNFMLEQKLGKLVNILTVIADHQIIKI